MNHSLKGAVWSPLRLAANRAFLDGLKKRDINLAPWTTALIADTVIHPGTGIEISLELAADPKEVLLMGYYFSTCLSPHGFCFYSAIANAVDVNKHVLYARDRENHVIGRCLIALGDNGSIVPFRSYCHDASFPFASHVEQFCSRLATAMNTVVSHTDRVSSLNLPEWYDDGAHDVGSSISAASSPVRRILQTKPVESVVGELQAALAPLRLDCRTLPHVLMMEELVERPELLVPLLPMIEATKQMSEEVELRIAVVAMKLGDRDVARARFLAHAEPFLKKRFREYGNSIFEEDADVVAGLLEFSPSRLLRFLRETRWKNIRSDEDETDCARRHLLSRIHEGLNRKALAARLRAPVNDASVA